MLSILNRRVQGLFRHWKVRTRIRLPHLVDPIRVRLMGFQPDKVSDSQVRRYQRSISYLPLIQPIGAEVREARVLFDVGSNAGYFSKACLDFGFAGKVVLFEPVSNLLAISARTLAGYCVPKIFVNSALGEMSGDIELFLPPNSNIGWITAVTEKRTSDKKIRARMDLAHEWAESLLPDVVKIDVEGYELHVLRPFVGLIGSRYRPTFLVELGWGISNPNWGDVCDVFEVFIEKNYEFLQVAVMGRPIDSPVKLSLETLRNLEQTIDVVIRPSVREGYKS